ncbi:GTP pyrophosphokinase [Oceanisphaera ostreae]|uniref:GTP pyrophosphokinase family protein n=1 Tax=Oceanisphaera ostreae TaxID=914151 RepID=A0ABW3KDS6_9GAMM
MIEKSAVRSYRLIRPDYVNLTDKVKVLLSELLRINGIKFHLIDGRTKTIESFQEKIRKPNKFYENPLKQLTDLSGVRVIVYYHDDVEKVANVLVKEFQVVEKEVSHQASEYNPEQFGYISLHYIVKIGLDRAELSEWKMYESLLVEVQIRTVLQHSWTSISHALQYKNEVDVPKSLRRKLNRLAGLFELADEQFIDIRHESEDARQEASAQILAGNNHIPIDPISLREFINSWGALEGIVDFMLSVEFSFEDPPHAPHRDEHYEEQDYLGFISEHCHRVGLLTIEDLEKALSFNPKNYLKNLFENNNSDWYVSEGFVLYLIIIRAKITDFCVDDLLSSGWGGSTAKKVIEIAKSDAKIS